MPALKTLNIALCGVLVAATVATATERGSYKGYEHPPYDVVAQDAAFEVRAYGPHIVAQVMVDGTQNRAISRGFRVLANYIFGGNDRGEKIAMTAPVAQAPVNGAWAISFLMPEKFAMEDLPAAESGSVRFVEMPAQTQLVLRFSGFRNTQKLTTQTAALLRYAADQGYTVQDAPRYYFYDDPLTPPWSRRNDVAVVITR